MRVLVAVAPGDIPRVGEAPLNGVVLFFAFGMSFIGAMLSGSLPAWKFSRATPNDALRSGGRTSSAAAGLGRIRAFLVIAEFALIIVLLTGASGTRFDCAGYPAFRNTTPRLL